jgi:hypothetical protein
MHSADRGSPYVRGDFQTPVDLASSVWASLGTLREVNAIIEPTVGTGAFLRSAPDTALTCHWLCFDVNAEYVSRTQALAKDRGLKDARIKLANAFDLTPEFFAELDPGKPVLAIGNPPWVTSASQGGLDVQNLPMKSNAKFGLAGLDAMTGKANFDIAEAVLLKLLAAVADFQDVRLAFLVKRSVAMRLARRLLGTASELSFSGIDAAAHFGVAVDAGLFVSRLRSDGKPIAAYVDIAAELGGTVVRRAGFRSGRFVEDLDAHANSAHLEAAEPVPWRQGVKHDAAKILELVPNEGKLTNGLGEVVSVEPDVLCPLYKGSDVANGRDPRRLFPLFQIDLSGPMVDLPARWPLLATYLERHATALGARRSRIYAGKPPFSIFGVGTYTLAPWKVVVSGLYPTMKFRVVGPSAKGNPPLVDDTCYLLPFATEIDAKVVADHLNGAEAQELLRSLVDKGAKRPITKAILSRVAIPLSTVEDTGLSDFQQALKLAA